MVDSIELTNLRFALGYDYKYHFFKQKLLENQYDNIDKLIPNLSMDQYDNLRLMTEVDMIINFIQYCNQLGTIAICIKNDRILHFVNFLGGIADKSIVEFYNKIGKSSIQSIMEYMGYRYITINKEEYERYDNSCLKYKKDVERISKLYNIFFEIYKSYKHGFRIIPANDKIHGNIILEARKDDKGPYAIYPVPEIRIQTDIIESIDIINNIFEKLYVPLIIKKFEESTGTTFPTNEIIDVKLETESINKKGIVEFFSHSIPWFLNKKIEPFY